MFAIFLSFLRRDGSRTPCPRTAGEDKCSSAMATRRRLTRDRGAWRARRLLPGSTAPLLCPAWLARARGADREGGREWPDEDGSSARSVLCLSRCCRGRVPAPPRHPRERRAPLRMAAPRRASRPHDKGDGRQRGRATAALQRTPRRRASRGGAGQPSDSRLTSASSGDAAGCVSTATLPPPPPRRRA